MKIRRSIFPLALAHMSCDLNQGALPVLLPFFMAQYHINYAAAATIVFASNMVSTLTQPLLGYLSDRRSMPWLIPLGVLLSGLGFSLSGWSPTYAMGLVSVGLSGLGVAMFHPEGSRQAHRMAGDKKASFMSLFTLGGQFGFAIGPVVGTVALLHFGLKGTVWFVLPALLVAVGLWSQLEKPEGSKADAQQSHETPAREGGRDRWGAFSCLSVTVVCRSVIFYGLNTFLPLFWINALGQTKAAAGTALTILIAGSMIGNVLGGRIADRVGYRLAVVTEFALLACFLPLLPFTGNVVLATVLLVPIGLLLSAPTSSLVVLGLGYLPNHIGFSSGITMGLAFSFGGMVTPLLGWVADGHGLAAAMTVVALIPLACIALVLALPRSQPVKATAP